MACTTSFTRLLFLVTALLFLAACGGGGGGTPAPATITREASVLTLGQETPVPTAPQPSNAISGAMTVTLAPATNVVSGLLTITGDGGRVTAAHIHDGDVGTPGDIVIPLQNNGGGQWSIPASIVLTAAQVTRFKAGGYYVNAHTDLNIGGEIRGQLISFKDNIQPIFTANCAVAGCHVDGGTAPMSLAAGAAIGSLVSQASTLVAGGTRVIPGDAVNSVLFKKINGTSAGPQMPLDRTPLVANDQNLIRVWIDMRATNN